MNQISSPKSREGFLLWFIKIIAGLLILAVIGVHLVINHLTAPGGLLSYVDVVAYYQNPFVIFMEAFFLVVVIIHSLLGTRSILLDLHLSDLVMKIVDVFMLLLGIFSISYGIWLLFAVSNV